MKDKNDILADAINSIKNEPTQPGPSQALKEQTLNEINKAIATNNNPAETSINQNKTFNLLMKAAAVITVSLLIGYSIGRLTTTKPLEPEQIQASIEHSIREKLSNEMIQSLQEGMNSYYAKLREDLSDQYKRDLNAAAFQILSASSSNTNKLLEELIISINQAQQHDRQWITASLSKLDQDRQEDKIMLGNAVINLAAQTHDQLQLTKQEIAQYLSYTIPQVKNYDPENPDTQN